MKMIKWSDDTENSIINFVNEKNVNEKNKIFTNELLKSIEELIKTNYNKYNRYLELSDIKEDILTQVYEELQNLNPKKVRHNRSGKGYVIQIIRCKLANEEGKYIRSKKILVSLDKIGNI